MNANCLDALQELEHLHQTGDMAELRRRLSATIEQNRDTPAVSHALGLMAAQWGELDDAVAILETSVRLHPTHATMHNDLGVLYHSQHRLLEASRAFQRALECDPDCRPALDNLLGLKVDALIGIARAEVTEKKYEEARERINEILSLKPDHAEARALLERLPPMTLVCHEQVPQPLLLPEQTLRSYRLRALYQEVILICVQHKLPRWWDYHGQHSIFRFTSVPLLRQLLREFVLRRAGDYLSFLRLSRELDAIGAEAGPLDNFLVQLAQRFAMELRQINAHPPVSQGRAFVLAFPVWGTSYIERFLTCCVPSLLAPGNLPTLSRQRAPILLIHTDAEGERQIRTAPIMQRVSELGIKPHFMQLDSQLIARLREDEYFKYWHLGLIQSIQLLYAKSLGADFHILLPDTLYAANYFRNLLARASAGNPVILQAAFRTEIEKVEREIAPFRSAQCVSVEASDLMSIALNCLHPSMHYLRMNDRPSPVSWPAFHALIWEDETSLHLISPHQTIGYLDASLVTQVPERIYCTLDSELDKILPEKFSIYCPRAEDGLVLIELSPGSSEPGRGRYVDAPGYLDQFWHVIENARHLEFFEQDILFPINPGRRALRHLLSPARIAQEKSELRRLVRDGYPRSPIAALVNGLLSLHGAETHPLAQARVPELRAAAKAIWESGRASIASDTAANSVYQVVRLLWHFDLLPEAHDCLMRCPIGGGLREALNDWQFLQDRETPPVSCDGRSRYVIGATVWGETYLEFFREFHLPSLLAEGNLPYFAQRGRVIFSIVTDATGRAYLEHTPVLRALGEYAEVRFVVTQCIPGRDTPLEQQTFYMRYGLLDHHHVYLARKLSANLVLLPPDTVISRAGLYTLAQQLAQGYDCCTVACVEVSRDAVQLSLHALRSRQVLAVEAADLGSLAVRYQTDYFRSLVVNPHRKLNAHPRELFWRVPGGYICHSIFMHPIILSARVMARPFHPNHHNVDWALLPRVLQGECNVKVLDDSSGLFILHCSDQLARSREVSKLSGVVAPPQAEYLLSVHQHDFPIHRRLFHNRQFFPVEDAAEPLSPSYLTDISTLLAAFDQTFPSDSLAQ